MEKYFVILGIFILVAVLLVNRIMFQITDAMNISMNILLCVVAAVFMIIGIVMKDIKIHKF